MEPPWYAICYRKYMATKTLTLFPQAVRVSYFKVDFRNGTMHLLRSSSPIRHFCIAPLRPLPVQTLLDNRPHKYLLQTSQCTPEQNHLARGIRWYTFVCIATSSSILFFSASLRNLHYNRLNIWIWALKH